MTDIDFVVCLTADRPVHFTDNLFGDCVECGCRVQFRPHAPPGARICLRCFQEKVAEDKDPVVFVTTPEQIAEIKEDYAKIEVITKELDTVLNKHHTALGILAISRVLANQIPGMRPEPDLELFFTTLCKSILVEYVMGNEPATTH